MPAKALGAFPVAKFEAHHLCNGNPSFISATVYCPSTGESLPSIVLVGGWMCGEHVLAAWGPFFASHGIVAMTIGTPAPQRDWPTHRCRALLDASRALQSENDREGSELFGRLDVSSRAVMGYSLGGGAAQLAALADPSLKCAIALAPHSGAPHDDPFPKKLTDSVPTLFLVGNRDKEAKVHEHSRPQYEMTGAPGLYFEINGGDHFVVTGPSGGKEVDFLRGRDLSLSVNVMTTWLCCGCAPFPDGFGTGPSGLAKDGATRGAMGEIALAWLQLFLQGDENARSRLLERPGIASSYESKGIQPEDMQRQ